MLFLGLLPTVLSSATPNSMKTVTEYFDEEKTKPEYQKSYYIENDEEVLHGAETFWFPDGSIEGSALYKNGTQDGVSFWNYRNGDTRWECLFSEGRLLEGKFYHHGRRLASEIKEGSGQWKEFDESAGTKLVYVVNFIDGVKDGEEINYDDIGNIYSVKLWEQGILKQEDQH